MSLVKRIVAIIRSQINTSWRIVFIEFGKIKSIISRNMKASFGKNCIGLQFFWIKYVQAGKSSLAYIDGKGSIVWQNAFVSKNNGFIAKNHRVRDIEPNRVLEFFFGITRAVRRLGMQSKTTHRKNHQQDQQLLKPFCAGFFHKILFMLH